VSFEQRKRNYESSAIALANKCKTIADAIDGNDPVYDGPEGSAAAALLLLEILTYPPHDVAKMVRCLGAGILVEMERDTNMGA
jgi:hypothetical protein